MTQEKTFILFNDKRAIEANSEVAEVSIEKLCKLTNHEVRIERDISIPGRFDRALLHLDDEPLKEFVNSIEHSFIALRLTTDRPGVPLSKAHILKDDPTRIVLAIRRMDVLDEPDVWNAFLNASMEDCTAIYEGRLADVKPKVSAMSRLFVEREDLIPALIILCEAYSEAHLRASTIGGEWKQRAKNTETAAWWLRVLDQTYVTIKNNSDELEQMSFRSARRCKDVNTKQCPSHENTVCLLIDRLALEAFRWNSDSADGIRSLLSAVTAGSNIDEAVVEKADVQLKTLVQ